MSNRAWVTLATNDSYGLGALVLAHSLRRAGSAYPAVVLITPSVTDAMRDRLSAVFVEVVTVDVLDSGDAAHLALLQRPELGITFTKIHCWNLTQYEKCVFLDADTLVVQNCDELFEREELSAAPDVGWPDCFNSGVFVFKPSADTFSNLIKFAQERGSFDGGDQGLLNSYFSDWAHGDIAKHLPFLYNVTSAAFYSYLPALKHYGQNLKIIHFIGAAKPWLQQFNWESRSVDAPEHLRELLQLWWDLFVSQVHSQLDTSMVELEDIPSTIAPSQETFFGSEPRPEYVHYKPVLDPDSEFHWHHPDAQIIDTEANVPTIDMAQFHDPWDFYRGHILPLTDETKSIRSYAQVTEEQPDMRRYVWEPTLPSQNQNDKEIHHNETHHFDTNSSETYNFDIHNTESHHNNDSHHIDFHHTAAFPTETHHETNTQISEPQSSHSIFHYHPNDYSNKQTYEAQQNNYFDNSNQIETRSSFSYEQQNFHHSIYNEPNEHNDHNNYECYYSQNTDRIQSPLENQQNSLQFHEHYSSLADNQSNHQHQYTPPQQDKQQVIYSNQEDYHIVNGYHHDELWSDQNINNDVNKGKSETQVTENKTLTSQKNLESISKLLRSKVEYVYCVHLDHEKERNRKKQKILSIPITNTQEKINGYSSESEIEDFIIPRHPYDGFYLRHRMTIDSRGRKICTHEIPPTPSLSPSITPPESPIFFDAITDVSSSEDKNLHIDKENHSGVAGNLARVSPGAVATQYEALDELTRRQGWEAGNIDYMGADSFANIWAKISQTLNQPPASVPKQPTPPPEEPTASTEVEAPKTIPADAPEESTESTLMKEPTPVLVDTSVKTNEAVPQENAMISEIMAQASVPVEESVSEVVSSEKADVPVETANIPDDTSVPLEAAAEIPVPVVEAVLAEVPTSIEKDKIPTPVLEAADAIECPKGSETETVPNVATSEKVESPQKEEIAAATEVSAVEAPKVVSEPASTKPVSSVECSTANTAAQVASKPAVVETSKPDEKPLKPDQILAASATDSPPLANTPSKEEIPAEQAAKSTEEAAQETRL